MDIGELRDFCLSFPHVTEDIKWENHLCFCIGEKMFIILSLDETPVSCSFKASDDDREGYVMLGVEESIQDESSISVYPNPAVTDLWIEIAGLPDGTYTISMLDVTGKTILQSKVELSRYAREHFSLSSVPGGVYFVRVMDGNEKVVNISRIIITE